MVSRKQKKAALQEKLQLLRSITNSSAQNKTAIILDASKYIQELKLKIDACVQDLAEDTSRTKVSVATLEKGLLIKVFSAKSFPGMHASILEAFENLGVEVIHANISCTNTFRLEAIGENRCGNVDAQMVRNAVLKAIEKCTGMIEHKEQF